MAISDRFSILDDNEQFDPSPSRLKHTVGDLAGALPRIWWAVRKIGASTERSGSHSVIVALSTDEVKELLWKNEYEPGWWLSYSFRGEVINRRRPIYHQSEHAEWWQAHIRGYRVGHGDRRFDDPRLAGYNRNLDVFAEHDSSELTDLTCHIEPEPKEHPDIHLKYVKYNDGTRRLLKLLEENDVEYVLVPEHLQPVPEPKPLLGQVKSRVDGALRRPEKI